MSKAANVTAESRLTALFAEMSYDLSERSSGSPNPRVKFAVERQLTRMRKRAGYHDPGLAQKAIDSFKETNRLMGSRELDLTGPLIDNARHYITVMLERFNTRLGEFNIQNTLDWDYLFDQWRFGPGASNGIKGSHAAEKIDQSMSCTVRSVPLVFLLRRSNTYFRLYDEAQRKLGITLVSGSRMTTVPKNEETERTIAIEPLGNMCLQLAAGRYLENVLRYIGLDISTQQPKNKALANRGSIDDSIATIDLKAASDMISIDLVRALLPKEWFKLLMDLRSPEIEYPDGSVEKLNMISTMGNGFTFPLMTLILCSLIYGFRSARNGPSLFIDWSKTCVFGDDIIIPKGEYLGFCEVLRGAGFIVNTDKSFCDGPFRESCGGDYFEGYDVTPFYVKSVETQPEVYVVINQVLEWCARHNLLLPRTLNLLKTFIDGKCHLVPEWLNPDQGLLVASGPRRYTYLKPVPRRARLKNPWFEMMLAIGGFIVEDNLHKFYLPRLYKTEARVKRSRIPSGFLDGSDPIKRAKSSSNFIEACAFLFFSVDAS